MNTKTVIKAVVAVVLSVCTSLAYAEPELLIHEVGFVGNGMSVASGEFELADSGRFELHLTDKAIDNIDNEYLQPFTELKAMLLKDDQQLVITMDEPGTSMPENLDAGIYKIYILGKTEQLTDKISQYFIELKAEDQAQYPEAAYMKVGFLPEATDQVILQNGFSFDNPVPIPEDGKYQIYLKNIANPQPLKALDLIVKNYTSPSDSILLKATDETEAVSDEFEASKDDIITMKTLAILADNATEGLFEIKLVKNANGYPSTKWSTVIPVSVEPIETEIKTFKGVFSVTSANSQVISFSDLKEEAFLEQDNTESAFLESVSFDIKSIETGDIVINEAATEGDLELELTPGDYSISIYVKHAENQEEIFGVRISDSVTNAHLYDNTIVIGKNFLHTDNLPQLSSQTFLQVADLCESARFTKLALILSNGTDIIEYLPIEFGVNDPSYCANDNPVIEDIVVMTSGNLNYQAHIYALPPEPAINGDIRSAMYNMQIIDFLSNTLIYEQTGSMMGDYVNLGYEFDIELKGSGVITLRDYQFPDHFSELKMAVFSGTEKVTIYSGTPDGASYAFRSLEPGKYFATIIADLADESHMGTYGITMAFEPDNANNTDGGDTPSVGEQEGENEGESGGGGSTSVLLALMLLLGFSIRRK
ncbi:MAG: hypothetical protein D6B28_10570 [Gammaproteobacteria bacterium]|nr:MAG: hypothetical protein D6B28_10570 [Gammaproteobacteria bacterium]